ncbi:MAG: hypothetical protein KBS59_02940 [Clostridiales bacterium]|nr:hypothetical protein [Clostridiales bacterium]
MKKINVLSIIKKFFCYVIGLLIIALGINVAKMSSLGISPASSVPRAVEVISESSDKIPDITLGTTTIIVYVVLVLLQILILRRNFKIINLLGIPVALVFGKMVDFVGIDPKAFGHLLVNFPRPESYVMKLVYMLASLVIIGLGVFLYLRPKWIPMPPEGLAGAISQVSGKKFGDCKTAVDSSLIVIALILQLIFLGGFSSFTGANVVVREGTVISAVCVGQAVKIFTKLLGEKLEGWLNK